MTLTRLETETTPSEHGVCGERRRAYRQMSVMLAAKITANGQEGLCRVHNISAGGTKIETLAGLRVGDMAQVEFRSDLLVNGVVCWTHNALAGIKFYELLDLARLLKRSEPNIGRIKPRQPRYKCKSVAQIRNKDVISYCDVLDVSISGARLIGLGDFRVGEIVSLHINGLSRHNVCVAWRDGHEFGVRLINRFLHRELETWLISNGRTNLVPVSC